MAAERSPSVCSVASPPDHLSARPRALLHRAAARLRLFRRSATPCNCLRSRCCSLSRPASWARRCRAWFTHPETPTLIFLGASLPQLFDRVLLAARQSRRCLPPAPSFPRSRDRRHRAHRSTGREPVGGGARLAGASGSSPSPVQRSQCSLRSRQVEAPPWLAAGPRPSLGARPGPRCGRRGRLSPVAVRAGRAHRRRGAHHRGSRGAGGRAPASLPPSRFAKATACVRAMSSPSCPPSS